MTQDEFNKQWKEPFEWSDEVVAWLNSRPKIIQELILKFPPDCLVMANRSLHIPLPGDVAVICSYFEDGKVSVIVPGNEIRGQCQADWLEVVQCRPGASYEDVRKRLK